MYLVGNQHRDAASQRFHHGDARVVLMRRKHEDIRCSQRAPFYVARQEPSPRYASINSKFQGILKQSLLPADFIWSRDKQVRPIHLARDPRKSLYQQITTLREMNPAEENYQLFAFEFRKSPKKDRNCASALPPGGAVP